MSSAAPAKRGVGGVEFGLPGDYSGGLPPDEARAWIDAMQAAVHAAADAFDTMSHNSHLPESSCDFGPNVNAEV